MKITQLQQNFLPTQIQKPVLKPENPDDAKLRQSAKDLESLFLSFVLKAMEKTVPKEQQSASVASMMFSNVMGKGISEAGGIGLSKYFYETLKHNSLENVQKLNEEIKAPTISTIETGRLKNE